MKFAPVIRAARRRAGMTQDDLARAVKVARNAIWLAEQGSGTLTTLVPLMRVLGIAVAGPPPGPDFGSRLTYARHRKGWSLREIATLSGLSVPTIRALEQNRGRVSSLEAAIRVLAPTARERRPVKAAPVALTQPPSASAMRSFIHGDCTNIMPGMTEGSIDLVVTSPPYNAEKEYEPVITPQEYERFAERWVSSIPRLLAPGGAIWLNVGYTKVSDFETLPLAYRYYPLLKSLGLHLIQEVVWHYEGGLAYTRRFSHRTERWMWWVKDPQNYVFHLDQVRDGTLNRTIDERNNDQGKNPTDLWFFDRVTGGRRASKDKTLHPCQFPVAMVERIIRACSNPGDVVLDPFGGPGSTAIAAYQNGRGFISVEISPEYDQIARERMEKVLKLGRAG